MATKRIYYFTAGQVPTTAEKAAISAIEAQVFPQFSYTMMNALASLGDPIRDCDYVCGATIPAAYSAKPVINPAAPPVVTGTKKVIFFTAGPVPTTAETAIDVQLKALGTPTYALHLKNYSAAMDDPLRIPDYVAGSIPAAYTAAGVPVFGTSDTTAPLPSLANVGNSTPSIVTFTVNEACDVTATLLASAFTVSGHTVSAAAWVSSTQISVTVSAPFVYGEAARVLGYTQPAATANRIKDIAGNSMVTFSGQAITNNVAQGADTTPPTVLSVAVANSTPTTINVTMSETMGATVPPVSAFALANHPLTAITVSGSQITLTTTQQFIAGETAVNLVYTKPATGGATDVAGNALASFSVAVTNNVTTQPLRFVTLENRIYTTAINGMGATASVGETRCVSKYGHYFGSGAVASTRMFFQNWIMTNTLTNAQTDNANAYTVQEAYLYIPSAPTPLVQAKFAGVNTKLINIGDYNIPTDALLPSQFGLTSFARDLHAYTLVVASVATPTGVLPYPGDGRALNSDGAQFMKWYDPTVTTMTVTATGGTTETGTASVQRSTGGICPMMLGTYVSGDPNVYCAGVDSRTAAYREGISTTNMYLGWFQKIMAGTGAVTAAPTNCISSLNFSSTGAYGAQFTKALSPKVASLWAYAPSGMFDHGMTNEIWAGTSAAVCDTARRQMYADYRAMGGKKVYAVALEPSVDANTTTANPFKNFGVSGIANDLHNLSIANLASGVIDGFFDALSIRGGTDRTQTPYWQISAATDYYDGAHLVQAGSVKMAPEIKTQAAAAGVSFA